MDGREQRNVSHNRNYTKDGSVIHCEWYNSALLNESGELVSVMAIALDVTERKQTEAALRERRTFELSHARPTMRYGIGIWLRIKCGGRRLLTLFGLHSRRDTAHYLVV